jgi:hypothetical protein
MLTGSRALDQLQLWERELLEDPAVAALVGQQCSNPPQFKYHLFSLVLQPMLDANHDGVVTRPELRTLQLKAEEFAAGEALDPPDSWKSLVEALVMGFDPAKVAQQMHMGGNGTLEELMGKLQVGAASGCACVRKCKRCLPGALVDPVCSNDGGQWPHLVPTALSRVPLEGPGVDGVLQYCRTGGAVRRGHA